MTFDNNYKHVCIFLIKSVQITTIREIRKEREYILSKSPNYNSAHIIMKIIMWEAGIYAISQGSEWDMPSEVSGKFFTLKLPLLLDYIRGGNDLPFQPAANRQNLWIEVGSSPTRISSLRFLIWMQMASCPYPARVDPTHALANISGENEQALCLRWSIPGCTRDRCFVKRA